MDNPKNLLVRIGDFLFKWRNYIFPVLVFGLIVLFPVGRPHFVLDILALVLVCGGLFLRAITIGWAYIKRGGLNKEVYADQLVTQGLFGVCRNPLYVGNILIYAGIFIYHGNPLVMILGIALYIFIYISIVAAEEHYLRGKFGEEYAAYCVRVPRWTFRPSYYRAAIADMDFNFKRVLLKDYTTIFNSIVPLMLIEVLKFLAPGATVVGPGFLIVFLIFGFSSGIFLTVRIFKKSPDVQAG